MNKKSIIFLRAVIDFYKNQHVLPNVNFSIGFIHYEENDTPCIRKIAPAIKLQEKQCELIVSELMSKGYICETNEFIGPKTTLEPSEKSFELFSISSVEYGTMTKSEAQDTHVWYKMGSFSDGAGSITRDKWYPMGAICNKCGILTSNFKINPTPCPKFKK